MVAHSGTMARQNPRGQVLPLRIGRSSQPFKFLHAFRVGRFDFEVQLTHALNECQGILELDRIAQGPLYPHKPFGIQGLVQGYVGPIGMHGVQRLLNIRGHCLYVNSNRFRGRLN